jgi:eukaryotic-like serine/threonine-protein kinase
VRHVSGKAVGRYVLYDEIATGGMATVYLGRAFGPGGFARTVAIKRAHPQYAKDPDFVAMFLDEARLAGSIHHPNVVPMLDVVAVDRELFLVMEYVQGESLAALLRLACDSGRPVEMPVAARIVVDVLDGLHAAHEARGDGGVPLGIVHRDVSPQNVIVGTDGVARVLDFGVAKAVSRVQFTRDGQLKGKLRYMSPEQLAQSQVDRRADVYAASIVLWEALVGHNLFQGNDTPGVLKAIIDGRIVAPSDAARRDFPPELDAIVLRGLRASPDERFATAREMAEALERAVPLATARDVSAWTAEMAGDLLARRAARVLDVEKSAVPARNGGENEPTVIELTDGRAITVDRPKARGRIFAGMALGAALVAACVIVILAWRSPARSSPAIASPPPVASAALPEAPPVEPAVAPPPTPAPPRRDTTSPRRGVAPARRSGTNARPGCTPPYTTEPDGTKVYKAQCI